MTDAQIDTTAKAVGTPFAGKMPEQRVSTPGVVDWHMILDHELDQLSQLETGALGSVGFVALGAAVGFAPAFVAALEKAKTGLSGEELVALIALPLSAAVALICLGLFVANALRNRGLKGRIRQRPKQGFGGAATS